MTSKPENTIDNKISEKCKISYRIFAVTEQFIVNASEDMGCVFVKPFHLEQWS